MKNQTESEEGKRRGGQSCKTIEQMGDSIQHREEEAESKRENILEAAKREDTETGNIQPTPDRMMF